MWQEEEWLSKDVPVLIPGNCMLYYMARGISGCQEADIKIKR